MLARLREARRAEAEAARPEPSTSSGCAASAATAERQLAETRERVGRVELESTEARVRLEGLTEAIRRDLDCEPEASPGRAPARRCRPVRAPPAGAASWSGSCG